MNKRMFLTIVLSVALSALVAVNVTGGQGAEGVRAAGETAFQRVLRTGTIKCGYVIAREFLTYDAATAGFSGVAYDVMQAIGKNLGLKVEWATEVAPATMAEDMKHGRYDMVCTPLTANAPRGKVIYFSDPVFFNGIYLWVRADDPRASLSDTDWANTPDVTIASIDGTSFATVVQRQFPDARNLGLPELSPIIEMLLSVQMRKADAALAAGIMGDIFSRENNNSLARAGSAPVYVQNHHFPLPHGDENMRNMINVALNELIYTGQIEKILNTHDTVPPQYYLAPHRGHQ